MKRPLAMLSVFSLFVFIAMSGCNSSRKIPESDIPNFKKVISLYEAKYKYGLNTWWKSDKSHVQQFSIATNMAAVKSDVEDFFSISGIYCESRGGTFSHENFMSISKIDIGLSNRDNYPANRLINTRMGNSQPSFSCANREQMLFSGYIVRRVYTTMSTGGNRGNDVIVWVLTTE